MLFAGIITIGCSLGFQSAAPSFDVASVRAIVHSPGDKYGQESVAIHPGNLNLRNVRLRTCIKLAYDLKDYQIQGPEWLGSPGWMAVDRYNVQAKAGDGTTVAELKLMLRTLLAERFKLSFHRETREVPVYALVATKKGTGLHPAGEDAEEGSMGGGGTVINGIHISISDFADWISGAMRAPVIDMTELKGRFDFSINYSRYLPTDVRPSMDDEQHAFIEAIQETLGFKFERRKAPLEMLIVDNLEKLPADN